MRTIPRINVTMQMLCEIPTGKYGKVVGMCTWHDDVFVVTEYGGVHRLILFEDGTAELSEIPV